MINELPAVSFNVDPDFGDELVIFGAVRPELREKLLSVIEGRLASAADKITSRRSAIEKETWSGIDRVSPKMSLEKNLEYISEHVNQISAMMRNLPQNVTMICTNEYVSPEHGHHAQEYEFSVMGKPYVSMLIDGSYVELSSNVSEVTNERLHRLIDVCVTRMAEVLASDIAAKAEAEEMIRRNVDEMNSMIDSAWLR